MNDQKLVRLNNLQRLCQERSIGPRDLVTSVGSTYSYWRDLLAGDRSFGEKISRRIEDALSLPRGWLDGVVPTKHGAVEADPPRGEITPEDAVAALAAHLAGVPERTRKVALSILQGLVESPHDAPEIAAELAELLSAAKRRVA
jgi:hypothetical protein